MDETGAGLEVAAFLRSLGATDEQIETARAECHLAGLATDLVLARGADLSAKELADRAEVDVSWVLSLWRTLGLIVPREEVPFFSESDVEFTIGALHLDPDGDHARELFRVLGNSLARVAETAVSLYVQTVEPQMDTPEVEITVWAQDLARTTAIALGLGDSMGSIFAHHLRDAIDRQRAAQTEVVGRHLFRLAVGFVDLVGFTALSQHSSTLELLDVINRFEADAFDVATLHGGRVVKHIGDEVMFVALTPESACAIADALIHTGASGVEPRGGVAYGEVISRLGDYYGPVVNLAARLADMAIPGEILVDEPTQSAVTAAGFSFRPAGRRLLKGFDAPIEAFALEAVSRSPI